MLRVMFGWMAVSGGSMPVAAASWCGGVPPGPMVRQPDDVSSPHGNMRIQAAQFLFADMIPSGNPVPAVAMADDSVVGRLVFCP